VVRKGRRRAVNVPFRMTKSLSKLLEGIDPLPPLPRLLEIQDWEGVLTPQGPT
jgi:hypothetical protein